MANLLFTSVECLVFKPLYTCFEKSTRMTGIHVPCFCSLHKNVTKCHVVKGWTLASSCIIFYHILTHKTINTYLTI